MKSAVSLLPVLCVIPCLLALPGCGSEPAQTPAAGEAAQQVDATADAALERSERFAREVFVWKGKPGAPEQAAPDVWSEFHACEQEIQSQIELANSDNLVQLAWLGRCMEAKGWTVNPAADPSAWK